MQQAPKFCLVDSSKGFKLRQDIQHNVTQQKDTTKNVETELDEAGHSSAECSADDSRYVRCHGGF
jgi:hypothetical protein